MAILVGIDGTGSAVFPGETRDREYDIAFANSFVSRICRPGGPNTRYFRGPVMLGGGLLEAVVGAVNFVKQRQQAGVREPVIMTGYSRGAAGVVAAAERLKRERINVQALMLFDCVDRSGDIDADVIPNNVGHVYHVIRNPDTSSRESFDNDGLRYSAPTVFPTAYSFMCTHGGMGGCPWTPKAGERMSDFINEGGFDGKTKVTYEQDAAVSMQVWAHCQPFLRQHGFIR